MSEGDLQLVVRVFVHDPLQKIAARDAHALALRRCELKALNPQVLRTRVQAHTA
jgi:hypothetical protein